MCQKLHDESIDGTGNNRVKGMNSSQNIILKNPICITANNNYCLYYIPPKPYWMYRTSFVITGNKYDICITVVYGMASIGPFY